MQSVCAPRTVCCGLGGWRVCAGWQQGEWEINRQWPLIGFLPLLMRAASAHMARLRSDLGQLIRRGALPCRSLARSLARRQNNRYALPEEELCAGRRKSNNARATCPDFASASAARHWPVASAKPFVARSRAAHDCYKSSQLLFLLKWPGKASHFLFSRAKSTFRSKSSSPPFVSDLAVVVCTAAAAKKRAIENK